MQFREKAFAQPGVSDPDTYWMNWQDVSAEVMAFRVKLRASEYLQHPTDSTRTHKSLIGVDLDPELHTFCEHARNTGALYFDAYMQSLLARMQLRCKHTHVMY